MEFVAGFLEGRCSGNKYTTSVNKIYFKSTQDFLLKIYENCIC